MNLLNELAADIPIGKLRKKRKRIADEIESLEKALTIIDRLVEEREVSEGNVSDSDANAEE